MCPPCPTPTSLSTSSQLAGPKMPPSHLSEATMLAKPETWELSPAFPSLTHIQLGSLCPAKSPPHPLSDLSAQPHLPCSSHVPSHQMTAVASSLVLPPAASSPHASPPPHCCQEHGSTTQVSPRHPVHVQLITSPQPKEGVKDT